MGRIIDPKDLIIMPSDDIKLGGTAYYQEDDGTFSSVTFSKDEMAHPERGVMMTNETKVRRNWGRMFLNRNNPWGCIR